MYQERTDFPPPPNTHAPVWRYLSHEKFEALVTYGALWLTRADWFKDQLEGTLTKQDQLRHLLAIENIKRRVPHARTGPLVSEDDGRYRSNPPFVSCWTMYEREHKPLWDQYVPDNGSGARTGVAIRSSYDRLKRTIEPLQDSFVICPVRYLDYGEDSMPPTFATMSFGRWFTKERRFSDERELRLGATWLYPRTPDGSVDVDLWKCIANPNCDTDRFTVPVDLELLFDEIRLAPGASDHYRAEVQQLLELNGLKKIVRFSELNEISGSRDVTL